MTKTRLVQPWLNDANCKDMDLSVFYEADPNKIVTSRRAARLCCANCIVSEECFEDDIRQAGDVIEIVGFRGNRTQRDRRKAWMERNQ